VPMYILKSNIVWLSFDFPVFRFVVVYFVICLLFEVVIVKFMVIVLLINYHIVGCSSSV